MLAMAFRLTAEERGQQQAPPPVEDPVAATAAAAALPPWLPHVTPAQVRDAKGDPIKVPLARDNPFLGGRWTRNKRTRCSLCDNDATYRGRHKCETTKCNHRDVCPNHSVLICQTCFYSLDNNLYICICCMFL